MNTIAVAGHSLFHQACVLARDVSGLVVLLWQWWCVACPVRALQVWNETLSAPSVLREKGLGGLQKESLAYAMWRVCGLFSFHWDLVNSRYQETEPATLILTTALVTYIGQRLLRRLIYGEGFVPNGKRGLLATVRGLPIVRDYVQQRLDRVSVDIERSLNKHYGDCRFILELPDKAWTPEAILEEMARNDALCPEGWNKGVVSGAVYTEHDSRLDALMVSVYERHLRTNPLHSDVFIGVRKMEAEVIRWCCNLFHGGPDSCGSMASGGTESLILACKAYRDYGYHEKGIAYPEIIVPATAHAGFDKAGQYLRIKVVHVPVDPDTMRVDPRKMKAAITSNTILASAPACWGGPSGAALRCTGACPSGVH
ncbi:hypothetical protein HPB48_020343 [Haemaphysalis longicornis]|uniref:Glutamate decarboxylase n=1 Tax=Haemaphysalis longicornis TaxID=44386 RepID=A0A9J6FC18_HAELO|nr:hypothetical protein HPB48_020343 [Haemaphysalis longicornis]